MQSQEIERGDLAKCIITGFEGIVMSRCSWLHNCDTVTIQPRELVSGAPVESRCFDIPQVELVQKGVVKAAELGPMTLDLGATVEDIASPFTGIVEAVSAYINGCYRVGVQAPTIEKGRPVETVWYPMGNLKLVKASPEKEDKVNPGGPVFMPARKAESR